MKRPTKRKLRFGPRNERERIIFIIEALRISFEVKLHALEIALGLEKPNRIPRRAGK